MSLMLGHGLAHVLGQHLNVGLLGGHELVQRGIQEADGDGAALHGLVDALKVALLHRAAAWPEPSRAAPRCRSTIISRMAVMRSPSKNMCSVRHRPMPCAPNLRACAASWGVSALVRTFRRRYLSAQRHDAAEVAADGGVHGGDGAVVDLAGGAVQGEPVALVDRSCRPASNCLFSSSILISPQPETQHVPMPRATTAAWEVMPPRTVRMPWAAFMPSMSSGEVSRRTRTTFSPRSAHSLASSAVKTILPQAAPGEAARPWPIGVAVFFSASASNWGCSRVSRLLGLDHGTRPSSRSIMPSSTRSHGDLQRGGGGALAVAGLEHVQLAVFNGELHVLHIAVVILQSVGRPLTNCCIGLGDTSLPSRRWAWGCGRRPPRLRPGR